MSLLRDIEQDLITAIKAKDQIRVSCLRMLKSSIKNAQIEKRGELEDDEIQAVVSSMVRKGKEAIEEFRKADRGDLAEKEEQELKVFYQYLPQQLTGEEIEMAVKEAISELSAESHKDLGKVMKMVMSRLAGRAQGKEVNEIARKLLS